MTKPRTGKEISCAHCGSMFYVPKNRFDSAKYCSLSCKWEAEVTRKTKACEQCGTQFTYVANRGKTAKYCSNSCKGKAYQNRNGSVECTCANCGKTFKTSPSKPRIFCSAECRGIGHRTDKFATNVGVRKALARRGLITKCEKCGYSEHPEILGVHHINHDHSDNRIENLIVLCPNCHSLEHGRCVVHAP
jgi:hypothetical protein